MSEINELNKSPGGQDIFQTLYYSGKVPDTSNKFLQLTVVLQSTLELSETLELFNDELSSIMKHDGLDYENHDDGISIHFGGQALHRCRYQLMLFEEELGELIFYRNTRFDDEEVKQLETMIAALIYPLRNALLYKQAVKKAYRDPVTGVNNRAAMDSALVQEMNLAKRHGVPLSMIIFDLDEFKQINDNYGHLAGDTMLKRVADCMSDCVRGSDIIYRYGGEEFVVLLRNTKIPGARMLADRIRKAIETMHLSYDELKVQITVSAGLSSFRNNDEVETFLERCDAGLYQAKTSGKNCVVVVED